MSNIQEQEVKEFSTYTYNPSITLSNKTCNQIKNQLINNKVKQVTFEQLLNIVLLIAVEKLKKGNKSLYKTIKQKLGVSDGVI